MFGSLHVRRRRSTSDRMLSVLVASVPAAVVFETGASCPVGTTQVDTFTTADRIEWSACEDLAVPGGGITLVPSQGLAVHLPKSYEPYSPEPDDHYYLGLGKAKVLAAKWDVLGDAVLNSCPTKTSTTGLCEPTWERVERAVPVMRYSQGNKNANGNQFMCSPYSPESGVRTFTGSRCDPSPHSGVTPSPHSGVPPPSPCAPSPARGARPSTRRSATTPTTAPTTASRGRRAT